MGIGKISDNYTYYEGYEGEPEIILSLADTYAIHIWEGYFDDIYDSPSLDGNGWTGFTRDYHQLEGIFSNDETTAVVNPKEYLEDLMLYKDKAFEYDETSHVFELMADLFNKAIEDGMNIMAKKI